MNKEKIQLGIELARKHKLNYLKKNLAYLRPEFEIVEMGFSFTSLQSSIVSLFVLLPLIIIFSSLMMPLSIFEYFSEPVETLVRNLDDQFNRYDKANS